MASMLKFTVMISTIGPHAAECRANARADERGLRKGRVANALRSEFLQKAMAHRKCTAVAPDILAHQENAGVVCEELFAALLEQLRDRSFWSCALPAIHVFRAVLRQAPADSPPQIGQPRQSPQRLPIRFESSLIP